MNVRFVKNELRSSIIPFILMIFIMGLIAGFLFYLNISETMGLTLKGSVPVDAVTLCKYAPTIFTVFIPLLMYQNFSYLFSRGGCDFYDSAPLSRVSILITRITILLVESILVEAFYVIISLALNSTITAYKISYKNLETFLVAQLVAMLIVIGATLFATSITGNIIGCIYTLCIIILGPIALKWQSYILLYNSKVFGNNIEAGKTFELPIVLSLYWAILLLVLGVTTYLLRKSELAGKIFGKKTLIITSVLTIAIVGLFIPQIFD